MGEPNGSAVNGALIDSRIATTASAPENVPHLLKQIVKHGEVFQSDDGHATRMKLLQAAQELVYSLETPRETIIRHIWAQPAIYATVEAAIDTGVFHALAKDEAPKTSDELASATGVDPRLLGRLLKNMSTMGVIIETGANEYRSTALSKTLTIKKFTDGYPGMTNCLTKGLVALPEHLRKLSFKDPLDPAVTAFKLGYNTELTFFETLGSDPTIGGQFNNLMSTYRQGRPSWMDKGFYPVQERLIDGAKASEDAPFLVDVGGSMGHDLEEFHQKWQNAPGQLILQDQKHVLDTATELHKAIKPMVHDFFTEQPIKGARAYYMHSILHDWTDDKGKQILQQLAAAMTPGYSKILINENVIPDRHAYWETTSLDIIMMTLFSSRERTEQDWHKLVESAGLKIVKIYTAMSGVESLIEVDLA